MEGKVWEMRKKMKIGFPITRRYKRTCEHAKGKRKFKHKNVKVLQKTR